MMERLYQKNRRSRSHLCNTRCKGNTKKYKVIETLSEFVDVSVTVEVPENTPAGERIYMSVGMILDRIEKIVLLGILQCQGILHASLSFQEALGSLKWINLDNLFKIGNLKLLRTYS